MDPLGWMSNLFWKRIVKSHVTWNGTGCLLTFSKTTKWSGLPLSIRKGSTKLRRQGSIKLSMQATSSLVTRRRSYRALRPPPHM
ncbi:hypothetical protein AB3S75_033401 [Citrus x aurantiifolia]